MKTNSDEDMVIEALCVDQTRWCKGTVNFSLRWNLLQFNCYGKQSNLTLIPKLMQDNKQLGRKFEKREEAEKRSKGEEKETREREVKKRKTTIVDCFLYSSKTNYHSTILCLKRLGIKIFGLEPRPGERKASSEQA